MGGKLQSDRLSSCWADATTKTNRLKSGATATPKTHSKDICHQYKNHENELSATFSFKS